MNQGAGISGTVIGDRGCMVDKDLMSGMREARVGGEARSKEGRLEFVIMDWP